MATQTLGTNANNSLTALIYKRGIGSMTPADEATIRNLIKDDLGNAHARVPGAFSQNGMLFIPNRGVLQMLPGDTVGVDSVGWPILLSAYSVANAAWTRT